MMLKTSCRGLLAFLFIFCSCKENKEPDVQAANNRVELKADTINSVQLGDTLVVYESTCRGCAFENSTHFGIEDSLGIIKLSKIITTDNNPQNLDGGNVEKDILFETVKTGKTRMKLYKFLKETATAGDSVNYTIYTIEVK